MLKQRRGETRSNDWRLHFLNAIIDGKNVQNAAAVAGVNRSRIYREQHNPAFDKAMRIARFYGDNRINWICRPIWPPAPETVQRHEATFQRIEAHQCYELVSRRF